LKAVVKILPPHLPLQNGFGHLSGFVSSLYMEIEVLSVLFDVDDD
jgi:hypothetical protein